MSVHSHKIKRRTIRDFVRRKGHEPLVCLTAYTAPIARIADEHADLILVGDSLGMVLYGMDSTVGVSMEMMIQHGRAVVRSTEAALIAVDMPFGSYQESPAQAFRNAAIIMKETGAGAVKLEGGAEMAETVAFLSGRGVPVFGHIGLQPQSVHAAGGYRVMGRGSEEGAKIVNDARAITKAGAFGIVLECVDPNLAGSVTRSVAVPIIGIGASADCDGQILVTEDMVGMSGHKVPKFVKPYANINQHIAGAVEAYAHEVRSRLFPAEEHLYKNASEEKNIKAVKANSQG